MAPGESDTLRRLYSCPVENGFVQVWERDGLRWLSLDPTSKTPSDTCSQSAVLVAQPEQLVLPTIRSMAIALELNTPQKILMLGLGGGDAARYISYVYPTGQIDAVENSLPVLNAFSEYFLPLFNGKASPNIYKLDAKHFLAKADHGIYDLIFVDVFNGDKAPKDISELKFFHDLRYVCSEEGVVAINLYFEDQQELMATIIRAREAFSKRTLFVPCDAKNNVIMLCFNQGGRGSMESCFENILESYSSKLGAQGFTLEEFTALNKKLDTGDLFEST